MAISADAAAIAAAQLAAAQIMLIEPPVDVVADHDRLQDWVLAQFNWYRRNIRPDGLHLDCE